MKTQLRYCLLFYFLTIQLISTGQSSYVVSAGYPGENMVGSYSIIDNNGDHIMISDHYVNSSSIPQMNVTKFNTWFAVEWSYTFTGFGGGGGRVIQTNDNNYLVFVGGGANSQIFKFQANGTLMWFKEFSSLYGMADVNEDANGDLFFICKTLYNPVLMKMNSAGNILWEKEFTYSVSGCYVGANRLITTSDGNLTVCGDISIYTNNIETRRMFLLKISRNGTLIWDKTYTPSDSLGSANAVIESPNGHLYLTGLNGTGANTTGWNVLLMETDNAGNYIRNKRISGPYCDEGNDIVMAGPNALMLLGGFKPQVNCGGNIFFAKLDLNLDTIFIHSYGETLGQGTCFRRMTRTNDGGYYSGGWGSLWHQGTGFEMEMLKVDSNALGICHQFQFSFVLDTLGFTTSSGFNSNAISVQFQVTPSFSSVPVYALDACSGVLLGEQPTVTSLTSLQIFPNPSSGDFKVELEPQLESLVEVYDLIGKKIFSAGSFGKEFMNVKLENAMAGVYVVKVCSAQGSISKRVIVTKNQ